MDVYKNQKAVGLHGKLKIICDIEQGQMQTEICQNLDISQTTVNIIWKNKDSINDAFEKFSSKMKKLRTKPISNQGLSINFLILSPINPPSYSRNTFFEFLHLFKSMEKIVLKKV